MDVDSLFNLINVALGIAVAYCPVIGLILIRKRLGALKTAVFLVLWGALIPTLEHAGFAMSGSRLRAFLPGIDIHTHYHFFMAAAFTIVAGVLIAFTAVTQLGRGQKEGWYAILMALVIGGGFELTGAFGMFYHGFPPSWALGLVIYAYPLAWASALIIAYNPVFKKQEKNRKYQLL